MHSQDVSDEILLLHKGKLNIADKTQLQEDGFENYIINSLKDGNRMINRWITFILIYSSIQANSLIYFLSRILY